jgi:hypothetical protein
VSAGTAVPPPSSLSGLRWFAVRYDRETGVFTLAIPTMRETYVLGGAEATRRYFDLVGLSYLGGRAMDSAREFGASQALVRENRAWGLDLTVPKNGLDDLTPALSARSDYERLLGGLEGDEDEGSVVL